LRTPGSSWINGPSGGLNIGSFGTGALTIVNGGRVINITAFAANIGNGAGSQGTVIMTGAGSTWTNSSGLNVGNSCTGILTVADGGTVSGSVTVAANAGSTGTLNIGAGGGDLAVAPGTLNTTSVAFGAGTGTLNFNHTSNNYVFEPIISGIGAVNVLAGITTLTASNTYTGPTTISGGALIVNGSIASSSQVRAVTRPSSLRLRRPFGVKSGKAQNEQMLSALPPKAGLLQTAVASASAVFSATIRAGGGTA
jgi:T5SS/PEP-CTERM-associated repeat protein/autotransporter-associated beta strand protein